MIKLEAVSKSFGQKKVINDLNLEVKTNEILSLLGPNGCGKTTLLNILAGLTKTDSGNIYIDDRLVNGVQGKRKVYLPPSERGIGYVFQTVSLFPHMRIEDNVAYGLKANHLPKNEVKKRTEELLAFVGLCECATLYPQQISGGQKQRAAIARSLATNPKMLLLDEPVSAIDPQLRDSFRLELKSYLRKLEITVIFVTHNLSEAAFMSDRVAVMGNGHVEQIGAGDELFDKPNSSYVAKFLGINVLNGKATKSQGDLLMIKVDGIHLSAAAASSLDGKQVVATIKPDDVQLSNSGANTKGNSPNSFDGTITVMTQMLSTAQITVDVGFILKATLPLGVVKASGFSIGDRVQVSFDPKKVNVFAV